MIRATIVLCAAACASSAWMDSAAAQSSSSMQSAATSGAEASLVRLRNGGMAGPASAPLTCQTPIKPSALPASQVQHLGIHTVGETVWFNVPRHTETISIIQQAWGTVPDSVVLNGFELPNAAVITLLTDPNGNLLYDDNAPPPDDRTTAHVLTYASATTGVVTLPNTTQAFADSKSGGYPAGTWSFVVNDYALECVNSPSICSGGRGDDQYDVTVITKPVENRTTQSLDVGIYLASDAWTATRAIGDPYFQRFARTLAALYAGGSVRIDTVTVYDLPAWAKARYATGVDVTDQGPCSDFSQLFTLSKPKIELPLFFVDAIEFGGVEVHVSGIDGSIPGAASTGGTVVSGAVVDIADLAEGACRGSIDFANCGADAVAYVSAHEGGHYLGLYHTTEAFGDAFDPLEDTPTCSCSTACLSPTGASLCASQSFPLTAQVCTQTAQSPCGGGDNLMFWLFEPYISKGKLSPEQGKVMRANPAVQ
ncbi:MAG TPA: hypothetical protein VMN79_17450 [Casimicrobiaceae bacterium]|nr:hypothetical protein [Casimicrobiaceae bacterium]